MRAVRLLDRLPAWAWLLLAAATVVVSFRLGLGVGAPADARDAPPTVAGSEARGSLGDYRVRLASGALVPVAPSDAPAVVMVSSVTCGVCAEAMRDLGRTGAALPGLRVVTLEGAALGSAMAARHGLDDVWHAGPADGSGATLLTFQYPGTPTFLLVEPGGRVRRALVGYPNTAAFAPWVRVMRGEAAAL